MAGGVALNCVANGRVIRETPMKNLFVQPAAGDAGGAVGVAHYIYNTLAQAAARARPGRTPTSGPTTSDAEIKRATWTRAGAPYETLPREELLDDARRACSPRAT